MTTNPNEKFSTAISTLRPNTEYFYNGTIETENDFNNVNWVTGEDSNGWAISTTTCPHSELTWTAVKTEMDKL